MQSSHCGVPIDGRGFDAVPPAGNGAGGVGLLWSVEGRSGSGERRLARSAREKEKQQQEYRRFFALQFLEMKGLCCKK